MKFLVPLTVVVLLTACSTPEDKEAAHQRQLEKEAKENFYAMRARLGTHPVPPPTPTPAPQGRGLFAFADTHPAPKSVPVNQEQPRAAAKPKPVPRGDGTVYYWDTRPSTEGRTRNFSGAEIRYARELAKRPENLTPEERLWAKEHY
ncbi:MAG TPA: hypothetical protein VGM54_21270 [Chthoniobacter sp.]|jgi:hypothetical protein